MTKEQWQQLYNTLDQIYSEFYTANFEYNKGKNAKIREAAGRNVNTLINKADYHISKHPEAFELLTGGSDNTDAGRGYSYEEFLKSWHFGDDLGNFLTQIKEKIKSL